MTPIDAIKDRRRLTDLLLAIEREFDVNALRVDGVHLWPIVRLNIGRVFKASDPLADAGYGEKAQPAAPVPGAGAFPGNKHERSALKADHRASVAQRARDLPALAKAQWRAADALRGTDFVVLSKVEKYYEQVGELRYSPILDPVVEDLRARGRVAVLGLAPIPFACVNEPVRIDLEPYLRTVKEQRNPAPAALEQLAAINEFIRRHEPAYCFDAAKVLTRYQRVAHRAGFFERLFRRIEPQCVFLSSFGGWLPAVLGARRAGVPTVDIQHGGQGPTHHPTAPFSDLPREGYALMPDVFWLWGRRNLEHAARWLPGNACRHIPVVGGNRKVARWYRRRDAGELGAREQAHLERFAGQPVVLVTLSYGVDKLLPEALVEAMRALPEAQWHVRLHPIHRNRETAEQIRRHLAERGCRDFFVDEPTEVQLPTALSVSAAHITPFSTACTEAIAMGVPTLICDRIGTALFDDDLEAQVLDFADDADGIAGWTRAALGGRNSSPAERGYYVETGERAVDEVISVARTLRRRPSLGGRIRALVARPFSS